MSSDPAFAGLSNAEMTALVATFNNQRHGFNPALRAQMAELQAGALAPSPPDSEEEEEEDDDDYTSCSSFGTPAHTLPAITGQSAYAQVVAPQGQTVFARHPSPITTPAGRVTTAEPMSLPEAEIRRVRLEEASDDEQSPSSSRPYGRPPLDDHDARQQTVDSPDVPRQLFPRADGTYQVNLSAAIPPFMRQHPPGYLPTDSDTATVVVRTEFLSSTNISQRLPTDPPSPSHWLQHTQMMDKLLDPRLRPSEQVFTIHPEDCHEAAITFGIHRLPPAVEVQRKMLWSFVRVPKVPKLKEGDRMAGKLRAVLHVEERRTEQLVVL